MRLGGRDVALLCAILALGCNDAGTAPGGNTPETADLAKKVPLYSGSIGLVVDTRDIFKRGYTPRTADISFDGQAAFNTVLKIDSLTDVAILVIQKDSLSAAQKDAFAAGIATTIVIRDANHTELGRLEDVLDVDDSNQPLSIATSLPALSSPVVLGGPGAAYILEREGVGDVVTSANVPDIGGGTDRGYSEAPYQATRPAQQLTFTPLADGTYRVRQVGAPDSSWCVSARSPVGLTAPVGNSPSELMLTLDANTGPSPQGLPAYCLAIAHVVLEQDPDGWMRLKVANIDPVAALYSGAPPGGTGYVAWGPGGLTLGSVFTNNAGNIPRASATRFRLISDDVDWTITDQGTSFDQPIMPPAQLQFAYVGTLTNCSSATLKETVGDQITDTKTTTFTTLESFQLFAGTNLKVGAKVGVSVGVPTAAKTIVSDVKVTAEVSTEFQFTTNITSKKDNTVSTATTSTVAVSRSRELDMLPFTGVIVADFVKAIKNVVQPFTQQYRVRGVHRSNGAPLSGQEIVTVIRFNFVEGVITRIGVDYVEFTIRGESKVDQFLQAETTVQEKVDACK